jgi:hypothetical protein
MLLCCLCMPVAVADVEPYGQYFARLGVAWDDASSPAVQPAQHVIQMTPADEQSYLQSLDHMQRLAGPYAQGQTEPLAALADYYRSRGDYEEALVFLLDALHVSRINDGLYSQRQVPLVRAVLDTYREAGELQALDERYDYFFRLYGSGQPPYTELRLRATAEYLRWQREAYRLGLDGSGLGRLVKADQLNRMLLTQLEDQPDVPWQWRRDLVLSQLRNMYLLQAGYKPPVQISGVAGPALFANMQASGEMGMDFEQQRLASLHRSGPARGRELLRSLLEQAQTQPLKERARVHLELGDWLQWNDQQVSAQQQYRQVGELLTQAGEPALLDAWLGQPVELPDNGAFWQAPAGRDKEIIELRATFDVNSRGEARSVEVYAHSDSDEGVAMRLSQKLKNTSFRPQVVSGEAQASESLDRHYQYYR